MSQPDNIDDATLEYAAQLIEERDILDWQGTMAKRKRQREDAQLRMDARIELKRELGAFLRAMKNRPELSAIATLDRIAEHGHRGQLIDAWPLAWKGWLNIYAEVRCNSNSIPPETKFRVELTERGLRELEKYRRAQPAREERPNNGPLGAGA